MRKAIDFFLKYELLRFIVVGCAASLVHYCAYRGSLLLYDNYNVAYVVGFLVSVTFNFFASSYFTFKTKPNLSKGLKFLSSHLFNMLLEWSLLNLYIYLSISKELAPLFVYATAFPISFILVRISLLGSLFKKKRD